ncbi:phosphotransferase [candidate division KSB3 bacterium]|uniref:Phosphotransferase n=1 Tax=candidate division KSB3 bacterium TaxID=2044937 RepID=A0A9D5Q7R2_9BACT|nr:phosphotransferase [candidate division KSB3 bacterium]MBD3327134.1 phosphotransferase [candidate division KSB3 bacterium]
MTDMHAIQQQIVDYLQTPEAQKIPVIGHRELEVSLLARGEYNLNYLLSSARDGMRLVFRVNIGTQIEREDQILYEYRALKLLETSGVTPVAYFVDDSRTWFDQGILIMEYLPGEPLDYRRDLHAAARLFASIQQVEVPEEQNHLIREDAPLSLIYEECAKLLEVYFRSDLANPDIRDYLQDVKAWMDEHRSRERYYQEDPWPCIVNTEVNSGNFIVNRDRRTIHLVDWEMPRWGDPSQDLCHFCSPLTTLWKTSFRMTAADKRDFLDVYTAQITDAHLRDTLAERVRLRDPFVYLRGISWSAMGWVAYQTDFDGMKNPDTWDTLQRYMRLDFIRSLFDPFISL